MMDDEARRVVSRKAEEIMLHIKGNNLFGDKITGDDKDVNIVAAYFLGVSEANQPVYRTWDEFLSQKESE